jgi:hypothetical protein
MLSENDNEKKQSKTNLWEFALLMLIFTLSFLYYGGEVKCVVVTMLVMSLISAIRGKFPIAIYYFVPVILFGVISVPPSAEQNKNGDKPEIFTEE